MLRPLFFPFGLVRLASTKLSHRRSLTNAQSEFCSQIASIRKVVLTGFTYDPLHFS